MSCAEFQSDLPLHADGELAGQANLNLLAHLKGCPECARRVYAQQQLKASVARVMGGLKAPTALAASVLGVLEAADRAPAPVPAVPRIIKLNWPVGLAAALALAAVSVWQFGLWPAKPAASSASLHAVPVSDEGPVAIKLATNIHRLHIHCATLGAGHHDPSLAKDPALAASQLSSTLGVPVLSGEQLQLASGKARFESAHLCKLPDAEDVDQRVAHLIFRSAGGEPISLMSMKALAQVASLHTREVAGFPYAILEPGVSTKCHPFTILAWSGNTASYVVCSPLGYDETIASVEPLRVAFERGEEPVLFLASLDP